MEQAIERFEQYIECRYPNSTTARHYVHDLRQFSQLIGKPSRAVTREDVDRFVEEQLERGLAATTVNRRLAALREFFEFLAEEEPEEEWRNPVSWKRHRVKTGKPLPRDLSETEVERLFAQITHPRDKAMFRLMLDVGLRVQEVTQLRVDDLTDVGEGKGRLRVRGKGEKERYVWLMSETMEVMQTWLEQRPQVDGKALFITRQKKGFSVRGVQERLAHYGRQAGIEVSPHQLRHTFGRRMAEAEMPVTSLAAMMGHSKVTTTQIYIAGAGTKVQADYQASIAHLKAARQEILPTCEYEPRENVSRTETADVWTLAGMDLKSNSAGQTRRREAIEEAMDLSRYWEGLPDWLTSLLQAYIACQQRRWKPHLVHKHTASRLGDLRRFWCWLLEQEPVNSLAELKRSHLERFIDVRLQAGVRGRTAERELSDLWTFLAYWEERGHTVSPSVFRVKLPKRGKPLPRFLSESDYRRLENHVLQTTQGGERDNVLDRVWFYLLSEAGLRRNEVCNLRLGDVDLPGRKLVVRHGKPDRDRTVPLSPNLSMALKAYLPQRGEAPTDHLLIYRQRAIKPTLVIGRLRRYGQEAQVEVSPHRLRHTLATRLLNAGMPITSLQHLLGHERLDTTLVYARVHNDTVQSDYERAYACMTPTSLTEEFFGTATQVTESQPAIAEDDYV